MRIPLLDQGADRVSPADIRRARGHSGGRVNFFPRHFGIGMTKILRRRRQATFAQQAYGGTGDIGGLFGAFHIVIRKMVENCNYTFRHQTHMLTLRLLILFIFMPWPGSASAAKAEQDMQHLRHLGNAWLEQQAAREWPNLVARAQTGPVDERLRLPACRDPQFSLPAGARLGTSGSVRAQCLAPARWSLYLSFRMRLSGPALVARRDLPARALIGEDDVEIRVIDYDRPTSDYLSDPAVAHGARAAQYISSGQPLLADWLARPPAINAGQRVRIVVHGAGFSVNQAGSALNTAAAGQPVRVRIASGRIVQGIAQDDGTVLVRP